MILLIGNDNDVVIDALRRASDETTYVNDATLVCTLYDSAGAAVSGATALSLTYVTASNGDYRGVIPGTVSLTENASYRLVVTSSNYNLRWETWCTAARRTS